MPSPDSRLALLLTTSLACTLAPFGDLTWYMASTWRDFERGPNFVSITPGVRTHLGGNLFLLMGVEIPLSNTRAFFREGFTVQLVQGF